MSRFSDKLRDIANTDYDVEESSIHRLQDMLELAAIQIDSQDDMIRLMRAEVNDLRALYDPFLRHFMTVSESDYGKPPQIET